MKGKMFVLLLLLSSLMLALPTDYVNNNMNGMYANNGQQFKNDGTIVNVADLLENISNTEFNLMVSSGMIDGYSYIDKFGVNPEITTGTDPEDIWEFGGTYNYDDFGTAPILYTSSSNTADIGRTIEIQGLDINGDFVDQEVTTNGQAVVNLTTPLWRVYRMQNVSDSPLVLNGTFYCHTDETPTLGVPVDSSVRAIIDGAKGQTLMALYTIPNGKVGFLYRGEVGVELEGSPASLSEYAHIHYESRRLNKLFTVKKAMTVFPATIYTDKRTFPDIIPSLTDIKIVAESVTQTMGLWSTFDILLIDEDKFSDGFLAAIGQYGY